MSWDWKRSLSALHGGEKSNKKDDPAADGTYSTQLGQQRSHKMLHAGANVSSAHHRVLLKKVFWPPPGDGEMSRKEEWMLRSHTGEQ